MVKLVDTLASGASALTGVEVQLLSWAPYLKDLSIILHDNLKEVYLAPKTINVNDHTTISSFDFILLVRKPK